MNIKPLWVMHVPVISTAHMPATNSLRDFSSSVCAPYAEGGFLYLPDDPEIGELWTAPILDWVREHFGEDANWVRFDCDADVIEGLPVFDWSSACVTTA